MWGAALIALSTSAGVPLPPAVADFASRVDGWILAGEPLPVDYRLELLRMQPDDRLQALIYLRRSGLMGRADPWPLSDLLRPARQEGR